MNGLRSLRRYFFSLVLALRQQMTWRKLAISALAVLVLISGSIAVGTLSGNRQDDSNPTVLIPHVETLTVQPQDHYLIARSYTGVIAARRNSQLGFDQAGRVVEILIDEGDSVVKGQPLAKLDARHLNAKQAGVLAQLDQAGAVLDELEKGPRQEKIDAAAADVGAQHAQLELAKRTHARHQSLYARGQISHEELEQSLYAQRSLEARREAAQQRLDELKAGTRPETIRAQQALIRQLQATLQDIQLDLEDAVLSAPFSGTITQRLIDEGVVISPGTSVVQLVESDHLELHVGLPGRMAASLKTGDRFQVAIEGQTVPAQVKAVVADLDASTRTRKVILELASAASVSIVDGQTARIALVDRVDEAGFWLPESALIRATRGLWACFVAEPVSGGAWTIGRRAIEVLHHEGEQVFVRGTLQAKERVVIGGTQRVVDRQQVRIGTDPTIKRDTP